MKVKGAMFWWINFSHPGLYSKSHLNSQLLRLAWHGLSHNSWVSAVHARQGFLLVGGAALSVICGRGSLIPQEGEGTQSRQTALDNLDTAKLHDNLSWKHAFLIYPQLIVKPLTLLYWGLTVKMLDTVEHKNIVTDKL